MTPTFYVLVDHDSLDSAFFVTDSGGIPQAYATEDDAILAAKEYSGAHLVVKAVARVTEETTHKVEKIK